MFVPETKVGFRGGGRSKTQLELLSNQGASLTGPCGYAMLRG
jgi:hypothetical protein